ncbi:MULTISPECIES: DUF4328 domain-containing protein [Streptomyces]|uniref:DUF4328 domain-containing protein n=1 Tax=Streptomyces chartreusis NRRL 3882 TaxID=1079985 RepID=A0A2N9BAQ1_STRCX|nr:DUF4328 domain-containing protein [Streptomyces chartreusis]MYS91328.1 DUF4328 domain-containing protein [Streptomyces sp. SID5464]SOR80431.1 hypothetical protein SCNRRL3882_3886 [Streptomyces chartreusis NRRL 3882]
MSEQENPATGRAPALRPVRGAAHWAVAALGLAALAWAVRAVWHVRLAMTGQPASGPPDQGGGVHRPLTALEDSYHLVSSVGGAVTVVGALVFLSWLDRVRDNARALSGAEPRYTDLWLFLGWIVPVVNLWIPRGIIADAHRSVFPDRRLPAVVNWWWGLWLAGLVGGVGLVYADSTDEVIARAYTDALPLLAADAVIVAAAGTAALMIRTLTTAQQQRMDEVARPGA